MLFPARQTASGPAEGLPAPSPQTVWGCGHAGTTAGIAAPQRNGMDHAKQHAALKAVLIKKYSGVLFWTLTLVILSLHTGPDLKKMNAKHICFLFSGHLNITGSTRGEKRIKKSLNTN